MACGLEKPISRSIPDNSTSDGKLTYNSAVKFVIPEKCSQDREKQKHPQKMPQQKIPAGKVFPYAFPMVFLDEHQPGDMDISKGSMDHREARLRGFKSLPHRDRVGVQVEGPEPAVLRQTSQDLGRVATCQRHVWQAGKSHGNLEVSKATYP